MLAKEELKRLLKDIRANADIGNNRLLDDIEMVCKALLIYRDLSAQMQWWGTGDETPHLTYLKKTDLEAQKIYGLNKERPLSWWTHYFFSSDPETTMDAVWVYDSETGKRVLIDRLTNKVITREE